MTKNKVTPAQNNNPIAKVGSIINKVIAINNAVNNSAKPLNKSSSIKYKPPTSSYIPLITLPLFILVKYMYE